MADDDPRATWASPGETSSFWNAKLKELEKEGGEHNDADLRPGRLGKIVAEARPKLGWEGVKIDLYCPDHGVREVERTFTSLGWNFDLNRPHEKKDEVPAPTTASTFVAMRQLYQYYKTYTPNPLEPGTVC